MSTTRSYSIQQVLQTLQSLLTQSFGKDSLYEAEDLLSRYLNLSLPALRLQKTNSLSSKQVSELTMLCDRRSLGEPVQYILGWSEFMGLRFKVNSNVLIPRLDSESMVASAKVHLKKLSLKKPHQQLRVLDLGAGSGALGIASVNGFENSKLYLAEISPGAQRVLKENIELHGLSQKAKALELDLDLAQSFTALAGLEDSFDLIVANPPYIEKGDRDVDHGVDKYEPKLALYAEKEGLDKIINWSQRACNLLSFEGLYLCEIGWKQAEALKSWYEKELESAYIFQVHKDLSGKDRYISLQRKKDV